MTDETIRTISTCCATLGAVMITQLFTYLNSKSNKTDSIYMQQYDKIFAPIHRILFFTDLKDNDKITRIYNVIYSNYNLSTDALRNEFKHCLSNGRITVEFEDKIKGGCKCLEKALGYNNTELNQQQQEMSKTVIYSEKHSALNPKLLRFYFKGLSICSILYIFLVMLLKFFFKVRYNGAFSNTSNNFLFSNNLLIFMLIIFVISLVAYIDLTYKKHSK